MKFTRPIRRNEVTRRYILYREERYAHDDCYIITFGLKDEEQEQEGRQAMQTL
jgi:hypothetical protein